MKNNARYMCFIDTEFNSPDNGQHECAEITEIGAAVFFKGEVVDTFSRYCCIRGKLSEKCKSITGITEDKLKKEGILFNEAILELGDFLVKYNIKNMYAFGGADYLQMLETAQFNNARTEVYRIIQTTKDIYLYFNNVFESKFKLSLSDICRICMVDQKDAHSALTDAVNTGKAYYNMKAGIINQSVLNEIKELKDRICLYRQNRSVSMKNIKCIDDITPEFIATLKKAFDNAAKICNPVIVKAVHDDVMLLLGRSDLEVGELENSTDF